jgi:RNA exonuclease 4
VSYLPKRIYNGKVCTKSFLLKLFLAGSWVSGVTPADLKTALEYGTCRKMVEALIRGKILVGHGLQNDLKSLGLTHPVHLIRDTAWYGPFMKRDPYTGVGRPMKLRDLAKLFLRRSIQQDGTSHDSCEDARAAMDLYMLVKKDFDHWTAVSTANYTTRQYHS